MDLGFSSSSVGFKQIAERESSKEEDGMKAFENRK